MPTLRSKNTVPAGGWRYLQPETTTWIESDNWESLVAKVTDHRKYKGISTDSVAKDIEDQLCMVLGEQWCFAARGEKWTPLKDLTDKIGLRQVVDFSSFMIELMKSGIGLVDDAEAQRRAAICRACPFNKRNKTCLCTPLYKLLDATIPEARKIEGLDICGICGCSIKLKVLMPQEVIAQDNSNKDRNFPPACWQNKN